MLPYLLSAMLAQSIPGMDATACPVGANWSSGSTFHGRHDGARNIIGDAAGSLNWNGIPVSEARLGRYLDRARMLRPRPVLVINVAGMSCARLRTLQRLAARYGYGCTPDACVASLLIATFPRLPDQ